MRSLFRPKRVEVIEGWRKLHDEGYNNVYSSPFVITAIKSKWMRWSGHVVCTSKKKNTCRPFVGKS